MRRKENSEKMPKRKGLEQRPLYLRAIAFMLAVSMVLTSSGFQVFAEEKGNQISTEEQVAEQREAEAEAQANEEAQREAEEKAQEESRAQSEAAAKAQSEAESKAQAESIAQSEADAKTQSEEESKAQSEADANENSQGGTDETTKSDTKETSQGSTDQTTGDGSNVPTENVVDEENVPDQSDANGTTESGANETTESGTDETSQSDTNEESEPEKETEEETELTPAETLPATLETKVEQEVFVEADDTLSVKYTIEVKNTGKEVIAEDLEVKAVLGELSAYYAKDGETKEKLSYIKDIHEEIKAGRTFEDMDLEELESYAPNVLEKYQSAVIWKDQTIECGGKKSYVFFARVSEDAVGKDSLPMLYFVDGNKVYKEEDIKWINEELLPTEAKTEETDENGNPVDGTVETDENGNPVNGTDGSGETLPTDAAGETISSDGADVTDESSNASDSTDATEESGSASDSTDATDESSDESDNTGAAGEITGDPTNNEEPGIEEPGIGDLPDANGAPGADEAIESTETTKSPEQLESEENESLINFAKEAFAAQPPLKVTLEQYPHSVDSSEAPIKAGENITWRLGFSGFGSGNGAYSYPDFADLVQKNFYEQYKNTTITLHAPDGIRITEADVGGTFTYSILDDGKTVTISLGDLSAGSDILDKHFTVSAVVEKKKDGKPVTPGTTYQIAQSDVSFSAEVSVLNRKQNDAPVGTIPVTGNITDSTDNMKLIATSGDEWIVTKDVTQIPAKRQKDGKSYVVSEYEIELKLKDAQGWSSYAASGRAQFAENFSVTDIPEIRNNVTNVTNKPVYIKITPKNFTGLEAEYGSLEEENAEVNFAEITNFATKTTLKDPPQDDINFDEILDDVPIYSTYEVEVWYKDEFSADFFNAYDYTVKNKAQLYYALASTGRPKYETVTTPLVENKYEDVSAAAELTLNKMIDSISGKGDYVEKGDSLKEKFDGEATFTIMTAEGAPANLYIMDPDKVNDPCKGYVLIKNSVRFVPGAMQIQRQEEADGWEKYTGKLYLKEGAYTIQETDNEIKNTVIGTMSGSNGITLTKVADADSDTPAEASDAGSDTPAEVPDADAIETTAAGTETPGQESVAGPIYSFEVKAGQQGTITATNTDALGGINFQKLSVPYTADETGTSTSSPLADVTFGLYDTKEKAEKDTDGTEVTATKTTNKEGYVSFGDLTPGPWYVREISTAEDHLLDPTVYEITVSANHWENQLRPADDTTAAPVTKLKNRKNKEDIYFEKWLISLEKNSEGIVVPTKVSVSEKKLEEEFSGNFYLQRRIKSEEGEWVYFLYDAENPFRLTRSTDHEDGKLVHHSAALLNDLPVYAQYPDQCYEYRIVEKLPEGYHGFGNENQDFVKVSETEIATLPFTLVDGRGEPGLTNITTGETSVDVKYYINYGRDSEVVLPGARDFQHVNAILCKKNPNGTYQAVGNQTTVPNTKPGSGEHRSLATLTGVDMLDKAYNPIEYFWAEPETTGTTRYVLEGTNGETHKIMGTDGTLMEGRYYVSKEPVYAVAYGSEDAPAHMNNLLPFRKVQIQKRAVYGNQKYDTTYVSGAECTIYQSDEDGNFPDDVNVLDPYDPGKDGATGLNKSSYPHAAGPYKDRSVRENDSNEMMARLRIGYKYRIYETTVPVNASGLKNSDGTDAKYVEVDLTETKVNVQSDLTKSTTEVLYDEPFRKVELDKYIQEEGGEFQDKSAKFDIYCSAVENGSYTLYTEGGYDSEAGYTPWTTVWLKPGQYYYFRERPRSGIIAPEMYGNDDMIKSGKLRKFKVTEGGMTKEYWGVATGLIKADPELYNIGTLINYRNKGDLEISKCLADATTDLVPGATLQLWRDAIPTDTDELITGSKILVAEWTTSKTDAATNPKLIKGLPVYNETTGDIIKYYIRETQAPKDYFKNEEDQEVTLKPGITTKCEVENEPMVTIRVQTKWEDCYLKNPQNPDKALENLPGATVAVYKKGGE